MKKLLPCLIFLFAVKISAAQCRYIPCTNQVGDTVVWSFTGGAFASYGCAPVDPTRWLSGSGISVTATFVNPQNYPAIRVWGMNDDDSAAVMVNNVSYPLTVSSASYAPKVLCGTSPGPNGVLFSGGKLVGANTNTQGNYSYSDVTINTTGVTSIKVSGISGAGWGYAGVLLYCSTGINDEMPPSTSINIYPNPASGNIQISGQDAAIQEVCIYTFLGECVLKSRYVSQGIDISGLAAGIYSVHIYTNNGRPTQKIIKI